MSKCFHHPDTEAVGFCRQCGKALCAECRHDVRGVLYCEECLAATMAGTGAGPTAGSAPSADGPNPALAAIFGIVPGVGAAFNGEYMKALIHILIFAGIIGVINSNPSNFIEPFAIIGLIAFIFYMPIEAYRTAKLREIGVSQAPESAWEAPKFGNGDGKATPIGPVILIVVGVVFLINSLDIFSFGFHIFRFWPAILIIVGAYMIWQRMEGRPPSKPGDNPPDQSGGSQ